MDPVQELTRNITLNDTNYGHWKQKELWTDDEKKASKMNSRAISAIINTLNDDQFKQIQDCANDKQAWDTLQQYYEGTTTIRRSRLDALASKFETIRMEEGELVTEFSSKLSVIASEANVLGKKHKEKKLVKKFLRCLPDRFESHLSAMNVALNTDTLKFSEVVRMIKAHEMDLQRRTPTVQKGIALVVSEDKQKIQELKTL